MEKEEHVLLRAATLKVSVPVNTVAEVVDLVLDESNAEASSVDIPTRDTVFIG